MATIQRWKRTCQECGKYGFYIKPNLESKAESWRDTTCRKCKSQGLDFGGEVSVDSTTNQIIDNGSDLEE